MLKLSKFEVTLSKQYLPFYTALLVLVLICYANFDTVLSIWHYSFDDGTYSHAPLILIISLSLLFSCAKNGKLQYRRNISWGLIILFLSSNYLFFITTTSQISLGYWLSFLLLNISALSLIFNVNIRVIFPVAYIIFLLPIWAVLTGPLQQFSVNAVTFIMSFTTIPVYVEQQFVHIPSGTFEIAGGCSGLRYLLVSLAISSLYVYLNIKSSLNAFILITFAILGALVTNWLRISILIIIGHQTEMTSSLMSDHNNFGWFLYIPFMISMFFLAGKLSGLNEESLERVPEKHSIPVVPTLVNTVLLITIITLSSTGLNLWQSTSSKLSNREHSTIHIQPNIPYFSDMQVDKISGGGDYLVYYFNGNQLDAKPTFYENTIVPEGWSISDESIIDSWKIYSIYQQQKRAILFTSFEIDNERSAKVKIFKLKRLKKAALGIKATQLHWIFIPCKDNCVVVSKSVPQI